MQDIAVAGLEGCSSDLTDMTVYAFEPNEHVKMSSIRYGTQSTTVVSAHLVSLTRFSHAGILAVQIILSPDSVLLNFLRILDALAMPSSCNIVIRERNMRFDTCWAYTILHSVPLAIISTFFCTESAVLLIDSLRKPYNYQREVFNEMLVQSTVGWI